MSVILGIDVGQRRIGIARSDPTGLIATPLTTVIRTSDQQALTEIGRLAAQHEAALFVVGVPLDADGGETEQVLRVKALARKLARVSGVRVVFWDERLTTVTALDALSHGAPHRRRGAPSARKREADRRRLDAAAAAVILQDYLDTWRASEASATPE